MSKYCQINLQICHICQIHPTFSVSVTVSSPKNCLFCSPVRNCPSNQPAQAQHGQKGYCHPRQIHGPISKTVNQKTITEGTDSSPKIGSKIHNSADRSHIAAVGIPQRIHRQQWRINQRIMLKKTAAPSGGTVPRLITRDAPIQNKNEYRETLCSCPLQRR